jgi:hypothetical protein
MAGDGATYGYYNTGHGKHQSGAITCLTCHDPAVMHVDGDARTYSAAADNYQAGYRLKSVGGEAPLMVPRPQAAVNANQFRLCFTCHDSGPFLNSDNQLTNFRADVDDVTGLALDPFNPSDRVNKHFYHLNVTMLIYDSDFDGVSPDSPMSCNACHNVHGPKLKSGATRAPGMIRTGELIGRESEGALNLNYFNNTWPDTTLSPTNELSDSTGGVMTDDPDQWVNTWTVGGVCGMCHNIVEPYWRAKNDVLNCTNCHDFADHHIDFNNTFYDPATDTSFTAVLGCATCHDDYDTENSTSLGLSTWDTILWEHDKDGIKDGSANTCDTCHQYNGSNSYIPLATVQNVINTYGTLTNPQLLGTTTVATCGMCHTYQVPNQPHGLKHVAGGRVTLPVSGNCDGCHDATVDDDNFVDLANNAVHDDCDTCHTDPNTGDYSLVAAASAGAGGGGDCTVCHSNIDNGTTLDLFAHDVDHATANMVNLATACQPCHDTAVDYPVFTDPVDPVKHITCASCHTSDQDLTLVPNASAGAGGGADCETLSRHDVGHNP